jgi:succinoglycan biosynthesis protein ExoO
LKRETSVACGPGPVLSGSPIASIIIPAWNASRFILRSVDSALSQSLRQLEVIVVDDGSTDDTKDLVLRRAEADDRLRYIGRPHSGGPSTARNAGISAARGQWLVLLDADDWMQSTRLSRLIEQAERRNLDLLADNLTLVDDQTQAALGLALDPAVMSNALPLTLADLLASDWPGSNVNYNGLGYMKPIIRKSFVEGKVLRYEDDVRLGEDFLFYARALLDGARFGLTSDALYCYAVRRDSISHRPIPTMELVSANAILEGWVQAAPQVDQSTRRMLRRRDHLLKFQVFTWAAKQRLWPLAFRVARRIPPLPFVCAIASTMRRLAGRALTR